MDDNYWQHIRSQFELPPDLIYLNNGSFGPCSTPVLDAVSRYVREIDSNPGTNLGAYHQKLDRTKEKLGSFVGIDPKDFVFITNLTVGMNMISRGLSELKASDEVLTTDQEYGAVDNAWEFVSRQRGFTIKRIMGVCT